MVFISGSGNGVSEERYIHPSSDCFRFESNHDGTAIAWLPNAWLTTDSRNSYTSYLSDEFGTGSPYRSVRELGQWGFIGNTIVRVDAAPGVDWNFGFSRCGDYSITIVYDGNALGRGPHGIAESTEFGTDLFFPPF